MTWLYPLIILEIGMDASSFAISDANTRGVDPRAPLSLIFRVEAREDERDERTISD